MSSMSVLERTTVGTTHPLLEVDSLNVSFGRGAARIQVLRDVSLTLRRGETVGLVGESGSGKTVTALSVIGLVEAGGGQIEGGQIRLNGENLLDLSEREMRSVRGKRVAMIFQQPTRALNPAFTVGHQIAEAARLHLGIGRKEAWERAVEMLQRVHIKDPARRARQYPHSFSGGMSQRAMIAMAIVAEPEVLIADEPSTALDVTVQARILDLIQEVQADTGVGVLFITHDLAVIAQVSDRVNVFYAGEIVEEGPLADVLGSPAHPYTRGLLSSIPRKGQGRRLQAISGSIPSFQNMPKGCRFGPRCPLHESVCDEQEIDLVRVGQRVARCTRVLQSSEEGRL